MSDLASALAIGAEELSLVRELKAGSETAFAQLIAQYSRPVYSLIARSLRDPADAADVTQEVFVKVFRNIPQLSRRGEPADLDIPNRGARGLQPEALVDAAQESRN